MKYKATFSEKLQKTFALGVLKLPVPIIKSLIGKSIQIDGQTLDPYMQLIVRYFAGHEVGYLPATPEEERREYDIQGSWFSHKPEPTVSVNKFTVHGRNGVIPCKIYRPATLAKNNAPAFLYLHGGGHVSGSLVSHKNVFRQLAHELNCAVVAVDYRLAPEHKFPAGLHDCLDVYDSLIENVADFGFDPSRISIGGDSAGANLTAVIAQQRKSAPYPPKCQVLWAPWLDMSKQAPSYNIMGEGFFLEKKKMEWYIKQYLNDKSESLNPMVSPLLGSVEGVCPAVVIVAGFDPLRDEGLAYAKKLRKANVQTELRLYKNSIHPFICAAGKVPAAREIFDESVKILKKLI